MDAWIDIRRKAREVHLAALKGANGDRSAEALVAGALNVADLELRRVALAPGVLGSLDRAAELVNVAQGQDPIDERVVIAHELGHFYLHLDTRSEVRVTAHALGGDPIDSGAGRVEGYAPTERKEVQADVFAGEFLCPSDWLRTEFVERRRRPSEIAAALGLPAALVSSQMARALLLPPLRPPPPQRPVNAAELDDSQQGAVLWDQGPLLLDAGPGTGKTRTLVRRIEHLLANNVMPTEFLALTFSNRAAEEMRERLSAANAEASIQMWVGTFHAFGLELLKKWPSGLGRTLPLKVFDQTASLALLEANLEKLDLVYYQNLYEPAFELAPVLRAISRCKDELVSPADYARAAVDYKATASDEEDLEAADKMLEFAHIYEVYEDALLLANAVDFGDLIRLAIDLIQNNADARAYVMGFKHVLVDEYQDVNFASAKFLQAIAGANPNLWVVADPRQSIYRFRGAEPENVARFVPDFKGTRLALNTNYRSTKPIVDAFQRFANDGMRVASQWKVERPEAGSISLTVAPTVSDEAAGIRDQIAQFHANGIPFADQVILARTHLTLARITGPLEAMNVPLLYLGDLFERAEIRDLLSLLALDAERGAVGLARVAALPEYAVLREEVLTLIEWGRANGVSVFEALARLAEVPGLSGAGGAGLARLAGQLGGLRRSSPWTMLTTWLFERSDYLRPILLRQDPAAQQQLIAIYQFLKVAVEFAATGGRSRRRFLARVRRIEALNEDTAYRAISSEATDMDAVRVMTIHGSKGLEFRGVHLPGLATTYMPSNRQAVRVQPPPSLDRLAMTSDDHDHEEQSLFFVALSRARDHLALSRAERYTPSRKSSPSKFLALLAGLSSRNRAAGPAAHAKRGLARATAPALSYGEDALGVYINCPARYGYKVKDGLLGGPESSAYVRFHACVYDTVGWLEDQRAAGTTAGVADTLAHFTADWAEHGPIKHPFQKYYRAIGMQMVTRMAEAVIGETGHYDRREWLVNLDGRKVAVTPDRVIIATDGCVTIQRVRTGKKTKSESDKEIYALLRLGARQLYPGRRITVEAYYLGTGERMVPPLKDDGKLLERYSEAIAGIESGDFGPKTGRSCPGCPYYLTCGG
ncbi:UvrD-helicase domain-containing protein [Mesorhizobium sp. M0938]|uniref:ATP-dependent helicase n=1 Tax=unclassified Mesorhizobium TaxID=325217 RepID=UPI00333D6282